MAKQPFVKPAKTLAEQVELLRSRGMEIGDAVAAEFHLKHINYYRLAAYWLPFEAVHSTHTFKPGTTFDAVIQLYMFDRGLRLLVLDAIERIEVSLRSVWAHTLALNFGAHAHLNSSIMKNVSRWQDFCSKVEKELDRSSEEFVKHLQNKYSELLPPIWATCEVMTMGMLSMWYENLGPKPIRSEIASTYQVPEIVLESWGKHLAYVRNICAHHSRLWNREFVVTPAIPKTRPISLTGQFVLGSRRLYNTLVILLHMMDKIESNHSWRERVFEYIRKCPLEISRMGFPNDWEARSIWMV